MTIDLSKLKVGDTVKFRCGGEAVINNVKESSDNVLFLNFGDCSASFWTSGRYSNIKGEDHLFDIIEIIPAPFISEDIGHGLYKIYWKEEEGGGSSLASVGSTYSGKRWFAPTNWTSQNEKLPTVASTDWSNVERVVKISEHDLTEVKC